MNALMHGRGGWFLASLPRRTVRKVGRTVLLAMIGWGLVGVACAADVAKPAKSQTPPPPAAGSPKPDGAAVKTPTPVVVPEKSPAKSPAKSPVSAALSAPKPTPKSSANNDPFGDSCDTPLAVPTGVHPVSQQTLDELRMDLFELRLMSGDFEGALRLNAAVKDRETALRRLLEMARDAMTSPGSEWPSEEKERVFEYLEEQIGQWERTSRAVVVPKQPPARQLPAK